MSDLKPEKSILGKDLSISVSRADDGYEDLSVDDGYEAAKDCMKKILRSVHATHGTLDNLRVIKLFGMVYSAPDFTDQHLVINGASDLAHQIFGKGFRWLSCKERCWLRRFAHGSCGGGRSHF